MQRYLGEELRPNMRLALIANDAIGNFVVASSLAAMLRDELRPASLDYYGGTRTAELQEASDLFDFAFPLHGTEPHASVRAAAGREYDAVFNIEASDWAKCFAGLLSGPDCLVAGPVNGGRGDLPFGDGPVGDLWRDQHWIDADLPVRYPFLDSGFIVEIFARLFHLRGRLLPYRLPSAPVEHALPDVLISASASLEKKLWPLENWLDVLRHLHGRGLSVGLIGAKPNPNSLWLGTAIEAGIVASGLAQDLRGTLTLPQVVTALGGARAVFTLDNGILHLASVGEKPIVGLFRRGIHRLWTPPWGDIRVLTPPAEGVPVSGISADLAIEELRLAL